MLLGEVHSGDRRGAGGPVALAGPRLQDDGQRRHRVRRSQALQSLFISTKGCLTPKNLEKGYHEAGA